MANGIPTLEDLKKQLKTRLEEVGRILSAINTMEELFGQEKTSLQGLGINLAEDIPVGENVRVKVGRPQNADIRPDQFLGISPLDAAKKYLRTIGRAAHVDEIANAVTRGSAAIKGAGWREELEESLLRSTREVVKVQEHIYGLTEFYTEDQLKGLRETRRQRPEPKTKKRGKKLASPRSSKKRDKQQTRGEEKESAQGVKEEAK